MITISRGNLYRTLRAVSAFMSEDPTRFHLNAVYLEADSGALHVVATDGHTLAAARPDCRVTGSPASALVRAEDVERLIKALKPAKATDHLEVVVTLGTEITLSGPGAMNVAPVRALDERFPPWRQVTPDANVSGTGKGTPLIGVDPRYLARAGLAAKHFGADGGGFRVSVPKGELDPIRLDISEPDTGSLCIIIMPMRV